MKVITFVDIIICKQSVEKSNNVWYNNSNYNCNNYALGFLAFNWYLKYN